MLAAPRSFGRRYGCLAGVLCILLLLASTTVQLTHSHVPHENHADCALCVTVHAAVQIVIPPSSFVAPVVALERASSQAPHLVLRMVLAHPLWNRPPPASLPVV
jgi:hypothetical protein